jgi:conjugal transfer mating pair stabilization protein TraG
MPPMLRQCATTAIPAVRAASITFAMAAMLGRLVAQLKMPRLDAYVDPALKLDISAHHEQNKKKVVQFESAAQVQRDAPQQASDVRSAVRNQGADIQSKTAAAGEAFDRNAEVTRGPDGTLSSKRSLMKQTGKQAKEDASGTIDDARRAVKDALRKE